MLTAIDCPNPTPPAGGYIERINPGLAIMRCNHTDQIYRIYCRNDEWADIPRDLNCPGTDISAANRSESMLWVKTCFIIDQNIRLYDISCIIYIIIAYMLLTKL